MIFIRALLCLMALANGAWAAKVFGLDFSPYIDGQNPNFNPQVSAAQILSRLQLVQPYTQWVRTYSMTTGLEQIPPIAHSLGLKVAAGAWIGRDLTKNAAEISSLIAAAQAGQVDVAIVGSESLLRGDVTAKQLLAYITQVRQAIPASIPVATSDTYDTLLSNPTVLAAGDIVLPNIYPYWEGTSVANAICSLAASYQRVVAAAQGKRVIISEAGWPSDGNAVAAAIPSPENAARFFQEFVSWATANSVDYYYFDGLDESWKQNYEGPQGAHWGILDKAGVMKPGMQSVFTGQTVPVVCNGIPGGPGSPALEFTYVPPYGTSNQLEGQVLHVAVANYRVVTYLFVGGGWWVKPYANQPLTAIQQDGSFRTPVVTGGIDDQAVRFASFLVPATYSPPILLGAGSLPPELYANSPASAQVTRTVNAISGLIMDSLGHPLTGVTVALTGGDSGTTATAPDGQYSFPNLASSGSHTVTPSFGGYQFTPASQTVLSVSGNAVLSFTAASSADLSVLSSLSAASVVSGSTVTGTAVVANQGPGSAASATVTITFPPSFTGVSASTTRGVCTTGNPVTCSLGALPRSTTATISLQGTAGASGSYQIVAAVSGPDPDPVPSNNTTTSTLTVTPAGAAPPAITAVISAKSGPSSARIWQIRLTNSGSGPASGARITQLRLTQVGGTACQPVMATAFPLMVGDLSALGGSATAPVTTDFHTCPLNARFTALITFSANAEAYTGSATIYNQFQ